MRFLLLMFDDPSATPTDDEKRRYAGEFRAYADRLRERGILRDSAGLDDPDTATVVKPGTDIVTDGPYAETTEHLGAFFHIDCADLDEAMRWASAAPTAAGVSVEIRPTFT